ncbi:MAG: copper-binding protein [Planctomycetota bacterium]
MNLFPSSLTPIVLSLAVSAPLLLTACGEEAAAPVHAAEAPQAVYETRGQITQLPVAGDATTSLMVRHEEIPDFLHANGQDRGMSAMTMPFPPAPTLDLEGFAVGDKVLVTFAVNWDADNVWQATGLEKLPHDTPLVFSADHDHHHDHDHHAEHDH